MTFVMKPKCILGQMGPLVEWEEISSHLQRASGAHSGQTDQSVLINLYKDVLTTTILEAGKVDARAVWRQLQPGAKRSETAANRHQMHDQSRCARPQNG